MGQGIYVNPKRDFCGIYFGLAPNPDEISGIDHSSGYLRAAVKMLAGKNKILIKNNLIWEFWVEVR